MNKQHGYAIIAASLVLLSGCAGILGDGGSPPKTETPSPNSSTTVQTSASPSPTKTPGTSPTPTDVPIERWNESQKQAYFAISYNDTFPHDKVTLEEISIHQNNDSMRVVYDIENINNTTSIRYDKEIVMSRYVGLIRAFEDDETKVSGDWVPKKLILEARRSDTGERYATGFTSYTTAKKYIEAEIPYQEYIGSYRDSVDYGPGAPAYRR